jgi:hypothetical protein
MYGEYVIILISVHLLNGQAEICFFRKLNLTGVFCESPAHRAGSSDTTQEINLNYRDAPRFLGGEHP